MLLELSLCERVRLIERISELERERVCVSFCDAVSERVEQCDCFSIADGHVESIWVYISDCDVDRIR